MNYLSSLKIVMKNSKEKDINNYVDFENIYNSYSNEILGFLTKIIMNYSVAQELTQETFIQVYKYLPYFRGESDIKVWIYKIAYNKAKKYLKFKSKFKKISLEQLKTVNWEPRSKSNPEKTAIDTDLNNKIISIISKIKPKYRNILILRLIHQFSYPEISKILNIPIGTVKSRLSRAIKKFTDLWRKYYEK